MTTMTASEIELVTLADIESAARGLAGVATRTPLLPFDTITERLGVPVFVKPEMLQRGGAFKFRGAFTYLSRLAPAQRERGVIAPSSGNHAQAVALAAKLFGVPATVVMPTTVTHAKRVGAERLGARIVLAGTTTSERYEKALELAHLEGSTLVPPYDDPAIIAGQGTVGLEIASDAPQVGTVIVQVGGGGLSAGVATAIKERVPSARVVAVEPAGAPKLSRARAECRSEREAGDALERERGRAALRRDERRRSRGRARVRSHSVREQGAEHRRSGGRGQWRVEVDELERFIQQKYAEARAATVAEEPAPDDAGIDSPS